MQANRYPYPPTAVHLELVSRPLLGPIGLANRGSSPMQASHNFAATKPNKPPLPLPNGRRPSPTPLGRWLECAANKPLPLAAATSPTGFGATTDRLNARPPLPAPPNAIRPK